MLIHVGEKYNFTWSAMAPVAKGGVPALLNFYDLLHKPTACVIERSNSAQ